MQRHPILSLLPARGIGAVTKDRTIMPRRTHYRYDPENHADSIATLPASYGPEGVQHRYVELRYDGERTISGTALRYGDVAIIFGEKERFESGAFGDVSKADVIMNLQHVRSIPIARSGGGGLVVSDDGQEVAIKAELPETTGANDALELIKKRVLRGLSVEFRPNEWRYEGPQDDRTFIIEKAVLRGVGVVDRPAYPASRVDPRAKAQEDHDLNEEQVRKLIEEALKARSDDGTPLDVDALVRTVTEAAKQDREAIDTDVQAKIDAAMKERDEARAAEEKAATEQREAEEAAEQARTEAEAKAAKDREEFEAEAESRADIRSTFGDLFPEDFEARGKSSRELLVAAVGDEVADADKTNRSEDWLELKAEGILERKRAAATTAPVTQPQPATAPAVAPAGGTPATPAAQRDDLNAPEYFLERGPAARPPSRTDRGQQPPHGGASAPAGRSVRSSRWLNTSRLPTASIPTSVLSATSLARTSPLRSTRGGCMSPLIPIRTTASPARPFTGTLRRPPLRPSPRRRINSPSPESFTTGRMTFSPTMTISCSRTTPSWKSALWGRSG